MRQKLKLVPCTCAQFGCNSSTIQIDGVSQPGKWIASKLRQEHRRGVSPRVTGIRKGRKRGGGLMNVNVRDLDDTDEKEEDVDEDDNENIGQAQGSATDNPPVELDDEEGEGPSDNKNADTENPSTDSGSALVVQLCYMLAIWLHVQANVSRTTVNTVLKALRLILATVV
ncbi:hypothetical protein C8F01DRAFT_1232752, partial [Mycena amicta]